MPYVIDNKAVSLLINCKINPATFIGRLSVIYLDMSDRRVIAVLKAEFNGRQRSVVQRNFNFLLSQCELGEPLPEDSLILMVPPGNYSQACSRTLRLNS